MELKFATEYKKAYPFPSDDIPQKAKQSKEYFLACANAIISKYVQNKCAIPYDSFSRKRSFKELRSYAYGVNSVEKYKDILIGQKQGNLGKRKTTVNISWDILQIIPEKLDVVRGYLQKMNYEINTSAIDYQAMLEKKTMIASAKLMANDKMRLLRQELNEVAGRPVLQETAASTMPGSPPFNNPKEVDLFAAVGGFFIEQEAAIKNLLDKTLYESVWEGIKDKIIDDLLILGIAGTCTYTEKDADLVKERYVDPDRAIIPYSSNNDYRDITYGGEIRTISIAQLRRELKIEDTEIIKIAKAYATDANYQNDSFYYNISNDRIASGFGINMLDQIEVQIADLRWIGKEHYTFTKIHREKEKNLIFNKVSEDYQLSESQKRKGKKVNKYQHHTIYKAKLVIGTSHIFDFGKEDNIAYKTDSAGRKFPVLPYKFVRTGSSSLVERCIAFADDANMSNYKLRIARSKMPAPPNLMIKKSALENVNIDGVTMKPVQLMRLLQDEGFLIVDDQNPWGNNVTSSRAIDTIPTDVIHQLVQWRNDIEWNISMIERVTGINDIFSAQTPSSETGLGVAKLAISATNNALYPIVKSYEYIFEQSMRIASKKWQIVATYLDKKKREKLSLNRALEWVKIGGELMNHEFDVQIEAGVTEDDKLQLMQDISRMRDVRRQAGSGGINESDYLLIWSMIKNGKIRQAQLALAQITEARAAEDELKQQQRVQETINGQMASNQQTTENRKHEQQQQADLKLRNELESKRTQAQLDVLLNNQTSQNKRKEIAMQNVWGWSNDSYTRINK